jgi:hypothetical protein
MTALSGTTIRSDSRSGDVCTAVRLNEGFRRSARANPVIFRHACKLGLRRHRVQAQGLALLLLPLARLTQDEEPEAPAVKREAEEDWGKEKWR